MLGAQEEKSGDFNAMNFFELIWSSPLQTARILLAPEGMGRARGQRPMRLSGVDERGLSAAREFAADGLNQRARDVSSPIGIFSLEGPARRGVRSGPCLGSLPPLKSSGAQIQRGIDRVG
jgi:hypothetical protein